MKLALVMLIATLNSQGETIGTVEVGSTPIETKIVNGNDHTLGSCVNQRFDMLKSAEFKEMAASMKEGKELRLMCKEVD